MKIVKREGSDNRTVQAISRKGTLKMLAVEQIDPKVGYYIAGFVDGEGSFVLKFRPRSDFSTGWKVSLTFNVSQKDKVILTLLKRHIGCGTIFAKGGGVWMYEVNNVASLRENVVPFFKRFGFLSSKKKRDFQKFCQLLEHIENRDHLHRDGILRLLHIRSDMNDGGKRKYDDEMIVSTLK